MVEGEGGGGGGVGGGGGGVGCFFFFNDTATTEIYTLSLHDALPICVNFWHILYACFLYGEYVRQMENHSFA